MKHNKKERIEMLQEIFSNTNSWLHFIEAKNAAIIAFNIAMVAAIAETGWLQDYLLLTSSIIIGLIFSTIAALWSFKPLNEKVKLFSNDNLSENLLHYAYIASLSPDEYLKKLYERYWNKPDKDINSFYQLEKDYCKEIVENSKITVRKQYCFKVSLHIILFTLILLIILLICA